MNVARYVCMHIAMTDLTDISIHKTHAGPEYCKQVHSYIYIYIYIHIRNQMSPPLCNCCLLVSLP